MSRSYSEPAEFYLAPSRGLLFFLDALHAIALLIVTFLKIAIFWKIALFLVIVWYWHINKISHALKHPDSVIRLWQETEQRFGFETKRGHQTRGYLCSESYKCPWFIIIILKLLNRKKIFIVPRDALSFFEYRVLCQRILNNNSR